MLGGGEHHELPHPHWQPLARLLLSQGADPNDGQALYNRMFDTDDEFLRLLFEFGLGTGDGGPWRRRLPDLLPPPKTLVRDLLGWAVVHDQRDRVALLADRSIDVVSPLTGVGPLPTDDTPLRLALVNGHPELADQLRRHGAAEPDLDEVEAFCGAVLAGDASAVRSAPSGLVDAVRRGRPGLIVWAAGQQNADAVRLLLEIGWDVDALGRADVPREQPWETALHTAVERDNASLVTLLLEAGADRDVRDARFDGTAADWADHLGHADMQALLA